MPIDDPHRFAELLEDFSHSQLAAQRIAIRTDVGGQNEALALDDAACEQFKINGHGWVHSLSRFGFENQISTRRSICSMSARICVRSASLDSNF